MNKFFGLPVAIDRSADPVVYGAFTSDPKCLYDAPTQRWFVTILVIDVDPATGDFLPASSVRIAAAGAAPDDGLTGYPIILGTNAGRWGDYSAAVADENGDIWFATEFIPNTPRTLLANWGTFIAKVPRP